MFNVARPVVLSLALVASCGDRNEDNGDPGPAAGRYPLTKGTVAVASDASGTKLVMVARGFSDGSGAGIWTSADGGRSWVDRAPSGPTHIQQWSAVASDTTGRQLVAVASGFFDRVDANPAAFSGDVWTSTDGGATWIDRTASAPAHGQAWTSVASDASGTKLVAATKGLGVFGPGAIWTSTDAGRTWTSRAAAVTGFDHQSWDAVGSDAAGKNLVAAGANTGVWASTDGGVTWQDRTPVALNQQGWSSVASDATGTRLMAAVNTGDIWTSTDGGATWRDALQERQDWFAVASDATGTNLMAVDGLVHDLDGDIWTSTDGGQTWTDRTKDNPAASGPWQAVAANAAGNHLVAVGTSAIWTN